MQRFQMVQDLDGTPVEIEVLQVEEGMLGDIIVSVQCYPLPMNEGPVWVTLAGLEANKIQIVPLSQWPARQ